MEPRYPGFPFLTGLNFGAAGRVPGPLGLGVGDQPTPWPIGLSAGQNLAVGGSPWPLGMGAGHMGSRVPDELDYDYLYHDALRWEGMVPYMYLDTSTPPLVTVGVGYMLKDVAAAQALPFKIGPDPAKPDEVKDAFNAVAAMEGGKRSDHYLRHPSLEISGKVAKELALTKLRDFVQQLQGHFPGFDDYPLPARRALVDMVYNLGLGHRARTNRKGEYQPAKGLVGKFPSFTQAVEAGDWLRAALACHRKNTNPKDPAHAEARNAWTRQLFEEAASLEAAGPVSGPHFTWWR